MCVLTSDIYTFKIYFMKIFYLLLVVNTVQCCKNEFNLSECPLRNGEQWNQKDTVCAEKDPSHVFHCQTDNNREVTGHCSLCAKPEKCPPGTYPSLHKNNVTCLQCGTGTYQSTAKPSNEFIVTGCEETHQTCTNKQYECKPGSKITERLCACDNKKSFKPDLIEGADCTCFTRNDGCTCSFEACDVGKQMNRSYQCEHVPVTTASTSTTTIPTSTTTPQGKNDRVVVGIAVSAGVIVLAIALSVMVYIVKKKKACCNNETQNPTPLSNRGMSGGSATKSTLVGTAAGDVGKKTIVNISADTVNFNSPAKNDEENADTQETDALLRREAKESEGKSKNDDCPSSTEVSHAVVANKSQDDPTLYKDPVH